MEVAQDMGNDEAGGGVLAACFAVLRKEREVAVHVGADGACGLEAFERVRPEEVAERGVADEEEVGDVFAAVGGLARRVKMRRTVEVDHAVAILEDGHREAVADVGKNEDALAVARQREIGVFAWR